MLGNLFGWFEQLFMVLVFGPFFFSVVWMKDWKMIFNLSSGSCSCKSSDILLCESLAWRWLV